MAKFKRKPVNSLVLKGGNQNLPYLRDEVVMLEYPKNGYAEVRLYSGAVVAGVHSIPIFKRDGTPVMSKYDKDAPAKVPKYCLAWDFEENDVDPKKKCPYCDAGYDLHTEIYFEAVDRNIQGSEPAKNVLSKAEKATGFKDKENGSSWTPVRVAKLPPSVVRKIMKLSATNKVKLKGSPKPEEKPVDDEKYGCDLYISFDPNAPVSELYDVQKNDRVALTEEEKGYLRWNIEGIIADKCTEDLKTAESQVKRIQGFSSDADEADDADEDEYTPEKGDRVKVKVDSGEEYVGEVIKNTSKFLKISTEYDDDTTILWADIVSVQEADDDDDDDEPVRKPTKKASKTKAKGRKVDDDEDDEDDEEDEEDEEDEDDEEMTRFFESRPSKAKGRKVIDEEDDEDYDDEDEDDDEEDEEDEDDEQPVKRKGKSSFNWDDDDEDEDDDDDEDEDEPVRKPVKKKATSNKKPAKKSRKKVDEDDDEDEDDDDIDF